MKVTLALTLGVSLLVSGCLSSKAPIAKDTSTSGDTAIEDRIAGDAPGQDATPPDASHSDGPPSDSDSDTAGPDIPFEDLPSPPDIQPEDAPPSDIKDPCAGLDCLPTCVSDDDCGGMGLVCVHHHDGCCSDCVPFCEICYMGSGGTWCPETPPDELCEIGVITATEVGPCWFEVEYIGEDGTDVLFMDGCKDQIMNLPVNQCGLTYDEMTNSFEVACNWCGPVKYTEAACGEAMVELTPLCVHAPHLVGAGEPFPVAVYGQTGCASFHHAEVAQDGFDVDITLWGLADSEPCVEYDACGAKSWVYTGLVWPEAPNPGAYTVTVGGFTQIVGATGGIVAEPACQDDCAWPELETFVWTMEALGGDPVAGTCAPPPGSPGTPVTFAGACQDFTVSGPDWTFPEQAYHCSDGEIYFGEGVPYVVDARTCDPDPLGWTGEMLMLGVAQGWTDPSGGTNLFLLRGLKQQ